MTNNIEKDRQLLENLDRLLAGREKEITGPVDDYTRTLLDVARKVASLRDKPSEEFGSNLKAQLIHQLAEQEKKNSNNQSFLFWEVSRRKMWQGTLAALIIVVITGVVLLVTLLSNRAG